MTSSSQSDAIVLLGAPVLPGGKPSSTLRRRIGWGIALLNQGQGRWLLVTGGEGRHPPSEARVMRCLALDAGIPEDRILLEERSHSTWDNARECSRIIRERGWRRVLLVTDAYHLPRGLLAFRFFGVRATPCPICVGHAGTRLGTTLFLYARELAALVYYLLRVLSRSLLRIGRSVA